MLCQSCNKSKSQLHNIKSNIMRDININICQTCIDSKFEPRWIIILAARSYGAHTVRDYIVNKRYVGNNIDGIEIV